MNEKLKNILACPECKSGLAERKGNLVCEKCKKLYKIEGEVPIFLENLLESEEIAAEGFKSRLKGKHLLIKMRNMLSPPSTARESRIKAKEEITKRGLVLNLGSSSKKVYSNSINLDIGKFKNVDVVADGKKLPFKNNSFDGMLMESVLEHVDEPEIVIKEAYRTLKKGGKIYISIPFVYVFHGSPNDFNRYTLNGLMKRLKIAGFANIKGGILCGPGSTINQMLRYYLALAFSFNSEFLFSLLLNVFGWLTFPLKYTDIIFNHYKKAHLMSSAIWAAGEK
jgi:uncharacterized protein YbaR (Trm112 family)